MRLVAQGISCLRFLQLRGRSNVAGVNFRNCDLGLSLKQNNRTQPLSSAFIDVVRLQLGCERSGIDSEERYASGERIRKCFENESRKWFAVGDLSLDLLIVRIFAGDRSTGGGIGQQIHDRV